MRILVLYTLRQQKIRKTISEHLFSFKTYLPEDEMVYVNVGPAGIPSYLSKIEFDIVIFHYTILAGERFLEGERWNRKMRGVEKLTGFKIAVPQDEYNYTNRLVALFKKVDIDVVCTCFYLQSDIDFAYAQHLPGKVKYVPVFTGYVDEAESEWVKDKTLPYAERPIDIGYRASMLPAHLGKHGQLKYELIGIFNSRLANTDLKLDIKSSNNTLTNQDKSTVKLGDAWSLFLLDCKAFIGCEGGSSLLDPNGEIQKKVEVYLSKNPGAQFTEIEKHCFPGIDFNISCFALSPRHFEAVITKTLQILVEGYYGGIFKPWVHYLPLKKDYSNFAEIVAFLKDKEKCQQVIENAYTDIVLSGKYTYQTFVKDVLKDYTPGIKGVSGKTNIADSMRLALLAVREKLIALLASLGWYKINFYHIVVMAYKGTLQNLIPSATRNKIEAKFRR